MNRPTLTYPISPDYVRAGHGGTGWNVQRALAEFIANALDEDPHATVTWADGTLTIEDNGPGIPEEGLLLGYSPKDDTQIGQFGEGSKIGALVLARDPNVGRVHIETVGYAFTPTVERRRVLDGIAPRRDAEAPEVLVYTFDTSTRTTGTKVTVQVDKATANGAMARFRHLTEPGYVPPTTAQVLLDGKPGRLFIGGVLVTQMKGLLASYDFPLVDAKTAQNRDRTVIDAEVLNTLVRDALAASTDPTVHARFVSHVLSLPEGTVIDKGRDLHVQGRGRLAEPERYFPKVTSALVVNAFRTLARSTFSNLPLFYARPGQEEAALDLLDKQVVLVSTALDWWTHDALMRLLGVRPAPVARERLAAEEKKGTKYVATSRLTAAERTALTTAITLVSNLFGPDAVDVVKVYSETGRHLVCADGFYSPDSGMISLRRGVLADPQETLEVLLHEAGHRLAHRQGREHNDRSRGFEDQLGAMLAFAVSRLAEADPAITEALPQDEVTPDAPTTAPARPRPDLVAAGVAVDVPAERTTLTEVMNAALPGALDRYQVKNARRLMDAIGVHPGTWATITSARPAGWRNNAQATPSMITKFDTFQVLAQALGLSAPAMWLAHLACDAPGYGKRNGDTSGPWARQMATAAPQVVEALTAAGLDLAAEQVRAAADGQGSPAALRVLAAHLIDAERDRVAAEAK